MNKIKSLLTFALLLFLTISLLSFHAPTVKGDESRMIYYSGLNGLDDTDVNYYGNVSSNLFHKQGNASLLVEVDGDAYINVANSSVVIPYLPPPPSPPYWNDLTCFGIYAYFSIESACPTIFIAWLNASGGSQVGFREHLEYVEGLGTIMVMSCFYTDGWSGNLYYDLGEYGYTLESLAGAWHWYEIDVWSLDPPIFDFYIDGNNVNMLWGPNPSDPHTWGMSVNFAMSSYLESSTGNLFYDYFRFYEGEEYPPWLIGTAYNIQVTSIPINASVKWDWDEILIYELPHNFSASAGLPHEISATLEVSLADPSIRYLFQGWSIDGSPTTNTSNPLPLFPIADMTLQAIYTSIEIPDVVSLWANFGIGFLGLIMMFLSWFVAYWCHKEGDTAKGVLLWLAMFIIGYGFFTVLLGG